MAFAPPRTWVASHTYHHAHTDLPDDPYSPQVHGFWKVFFLTPLLVTQWRRRHGPAIITEYTRGMPDQSFYAFCDQTWFCLTMSSSFAAGLLLGFGGRGLLLYLLQLIGLYLLSGWINAGAHTVGNRPFDNSGVNRRNQILTHCFRALPPGGRMVIQEMCDGSESGHLPGVVFVAEEHLPGDRLGSYVSIQHAARQAGFHVAHLECLGRHYCTTTLEWARRLADRFDEAEGMVGYRTAMAHLLVQLGFAWYFEVGAIDLLQYVLVKPV